MPPRGFFAGSTLLQSKAPPRLLPACGACGLFKGCKSPKLATPQAGQRVLVVVDGPTEAADAAGKWEPPQEVRRLLAGRGMLPTRDYATTGATICYTPRGPTTEQAGHCKPALVRLINELQPAVVLPFGVAATHALLADEWREGIGSMDMWTGWQIPLGSLNAWVCPMPGEDDLVRMNSGKFPNTVAQLWVGRYLEAALDMVPFGRPYGDGGPPDYEAQVRIVTDPAQAAHMLDKVTAKGCGMVAFDYETNMLKPDNPDAFIASASVAWGTGDWPEVVFAYPWVGPAIEATGRLLRSPLPKVASNLKFEQRWTQWAFGHRVRRWYWDTMLAAHVLDNRKGITSIKFQSLVHLGKAVYDDHVRPFLKAKTAGGSNRILQEVELRDLLRYNGLDSLLEYLVALRQMQAMNYPLPFQGGNA